MDADRPLTREQFRFFEERRARYDAIDAQGIIYNARYLDFFDLIVHDYVLALKPDYFEWAKREGRDFNAVHVEIDYAAPLHLGEPFTVAARIDGLGRSSIRWRCAIFIPGETAPTTTCRIVWVYADQAARQSLPLPEDLRAAFEGFERGV